MVDIAGAAAGPQLNTRYDPLQAGAQASQVATNIAPGQASGVTAPGNTDAEGEGTGGQGSFDNPASGENRVQAQLEDERPLSPIEEAIRDFPPDAVVQRQQDIEAELSGTSPTDDGDPPAEDPTAGDPAADNPAAAQGGGEGTAAAAEGNDFGVTESEAAEQAQVAARQAEDRDPVNEEGGPREQPAAEPSGATEDPFNLANGAAGSGRPTGQPAAQPPGSTVDIAA